MVPLYKTFVRPRLEFGVAAWSPWTETDIRCLENVQRRLVRLLSDVKGGSYEEKIQDAGLTTLKERRERGDAIEVFKTLKHINNIESERWFREVGDDARPLRSNTCMGEEGERRKEHVLEVERSNLEIRRNFFVVRAAKAWNEIPERVKRATTTNGFKNAYDSWKIRKENYSPVYAAAEDTDSRDTAEEQ